ncbi:hypothetical protein BDR03DRAFT_967782 [Suillus americanus]|nr:hypothetical protein BDR03DRAFT_967782 [Suillus americanus]
MVGLLSTSIILSVGVGLQVIIATSLRILTSLECLINKRNCVCFKQACSSLDPTCPTRGLAEMCLVALSNLPFEHDGNEL